MSSAFTLVLWYVDRATGLVLYPALWVAVLTGVFMRASAFGALTRFSRRYHVLVATFAVIMMLAHSVVGLVDADMLLDGEAPPPNYPMAVFVAGVVVGVVAAVVVIVAVLGFLSPTRFDHPRLVHALAYGGFAFGTVHAVLIGTDVTGLLVQGIEAAVALLVVALVAKAADVVGIAKFVTRQ